MNATRSLLLPFVGGLCVAASMPPWGFWPLSFIGVALLGWRHDARASRRAVSGFVFAIGWLAPATAWMWFLTPPGHVAAVIVFSMFHAVAAATVAPSSWSPFARAGAHTLAEAARLAVPFGGVPLATMGIAQASGPLLDVARVGGVLLISLVVMTVSFTIPPLIRSIRDRAVTGCSLAPILGSSAVFVLATIAPAGHDIDGGTVRVAAVQGGGRQGTSALEVPSRDVTAAHLAATTKIEVDPELDLVVWPENAIDVNRVSFAESDQAAAIAAEASRLGVPFLVGVTEDAEYVYDVGPGNFVNAQYTVMPDGSVVDRYVKVVRVPYGEYVPLRGLLEALGAPVDQIPSDALAGRGPAVLDVPGVARAAVVISWEVFFGRRTRDGVTSGGELLVNPTNGASYTWTILQTQQVASSRLRAVESGRWVIQVAPTGFSAIIDPDGRVLQRSDISEQRVLTGDVMRRTGLTWYARLGDTWVAAVAFIVVAAPMFRRRRSPSPDHR